jgi:hypothetical protein
MNFIEDLAFAENSIESLTFLGEPPRLLGSFAFGDNPLNSVTYCKNVSGDWSSIEIGGIAPQLSDGCDLDNDQSEPIQYATFDIDQNGSFDALTDGLILLRYAFGLRGDSLISGATASDATRTSASEIEEHIQSYLP